MVNDIHIYERFPYTIYMNSDPPHDARSEEVEISKAHELAAMTDERALEIIRTLRSVEPIESDPMNGMGLVEQQRIFRKSKDWGRLQPDPAT